MAYWVIQQHLAINYKKFESHHLILQTYLFSHSLFWWHKLGHSRLSPLCHHRTLTPWSNSINFTSLTTLDIPFSSTVLLRIKTKSLEGSLALHLNQATSNMAAKGLSLWLFSSYVSDSFVIPWTIPHRLLSPGIIQAKILEWIVISFSRGIFLTQGSNSSLPHWQMDSLPPSYQGSPLIWFGWSGWLGGCPLPPSLLHVLGWRGWASLDQSSVMGIRRMPIWMWFLNFHWNPWCGIQGFRHSDLQHYFMLNPWLYSTVQHITCSFKL